MKKPIYASIILVVLILAGCSESNTNNTSSKTSLPNNTPSATKGKHDLTIQTVPTLNGNYYGQFFLTKASAKVSLAEFQDSDVSWMTFDKTPYTVSNAFFTNSPSVSQLSVNSAAYTDDASGSAHNYYVDGPTYYLNGTANVFQWNDGVSVQTMPLSYNAPDIDIVTPTFMSTVTKSGGLVVTWTTSAANNDYVQITLHGQKFIPNNAGNSSGSVGYYSAYADDTGSFTIPSSALSAFSESKAVLTIARGRVLETTLNAKNYLFVLSTVRSIDVALQ